MLYIFVSTKNPSRMEWFKQTVKQVFGAETCKYLYAECRLPVFTLFLKRENNCYGIRIFL
ncbi:hypothetical protein AB669_05720 [Pedobacter sp. BMA]|nr:hypothetical protein AB669_05720 [Pedobacter sp. BMA]